MVTGVKKAGCAQLPEVLRVPTEAVDHSIGHHEPCSLPCCLHVPQHAPLVDVGVVALHAGVTAAPIEPPRDVDHVCSDRGGSQAVSHAHGARLQHGLQTTENTPWHSGSQDEPRLLSLAHRPNKQTRVPSGP